VNRGFVFIVGFRKTNLGSWKIEWNPRGRRAIGCGRTATGSITTGGDTLVAHFMESGRPENGSNSQYIPPEFGL
jgi:hypothetical protein